MRSSRNIAALFAGLLCAVCLTLAGHVAGGAPQAEPGSPQTPPKRGEVRLNPKDGLNYVWIPPGTFMMGCSPGDTECNGMEKPAHLVTISKGFWIGQTLVTVGAYKRFAAAAAREMPDAPGFNANWNNEKTPIVKVYWTGSQGYCQWIGGRLPTEAEWEYAARGGSTEARYGNLNEIAWYDKNSGGQPHEVAQKRPNGFGLYDMLGNEFEWVNDPYADYQDGPAQDPVVPNGSPLRVLRGGSWDSYAGAIRVSFRYVRPAIASTSIGFRCVGEANLR